MRTSISLLLLAVLLAGCAVTGGGGRAPAWLDHPYDRQYDRQQYLAATGSGSTREQAVSSAQASLAQIFNLSVDSLLEVTTRSTSDQVADGGARFSHATELFDLGRVTTQVDSIVASEVVNVHTDALGRTYARVVVDRAKSAALQQQTVDELRRARRQLQSRRMTEPTLLGQYVLLLQELSLAREEQALSNQIQVLLDKPLGQVVLPLEQELGRLASRIGVSVTVDGPEDEASMIQAAFEHAMQQLGFSVGHGGGQYRLEAAYWTEDVVLDQSPYDYARSTLTARLLDEDRIYLSYERTSREAAMNPAEAQARALRSAAGDGVQMFVARLLQKLSDEH